MRTWIFQGNPDDFDVDGYLKASGGVIQWSVGRYSNEIQPGDSAYIWRSKGKSKNPGGIVALGTILERPTLQPADPSLLSFLVHAPNPDYLMRTRIRLNKVANSQEFLPRDMIREDSVLKDMLIMRQAAGTIFPVTEVQADMLRRLWSSAQSNTSVNDAADADGDQPDEKAVARRNPTWARDELILALDLYVKFQGNPPGKTSPEIVGLSELLNKMRLAEGVNGEFRNPNGVYMKIMNFRRFDPAYQAEGKVGLQRGGKDEEQVWNHFANDAEALHAAATAIRANVLEGGLAEPVDLQDDIVEAAEGHVLTKQHQVRERNRSLVEAKKRTVMRAGGRLVCEACGFDFEERYGERGKGFIEAHHTKPLHTLLPGTKTRLEDLSLLCSNCHRMIHAKSPWLSVSEVTGLLGK